MGFDGGDLRARTKNKSIGTLLHEIQRDAEISEHIGKTLEPLRTGKPLNLSESISFQYIQELKSLQQGAPHKVFAKKKNLKRISNEIVSRVGSGDIKKLKLSKADRGKLSAEFLELATEFYSIAHGVKRSKKLHLREIAKTFKNRFSRRMNVEASTALSQLDVLKYDFNNNAYLRVYDFLSEAIRSNQEDVAHQIQKLGSAKYFVYDRIAIVVLDFIESGDFHIYRGVLNPLSDGKDLVRIYENVTQEMLAGGHITKDLHESLLTTLKQSIAESG